VALNVIPAMVTVPLCGAPEFANACSVTQPVPDPGDPDITVIQFAFETAVQGHAEGAVTLIDIVPPLTAKIPLPGLMLYVHAPLWVMVTF